MYRITPIGKHLTQDDYIHGFKIHLHHYNRVRDARKRLGLPTLSDFTEDYDTRTGMNIEGNPFHTRPHPWHDLRLVENSSGKIYVVDSVHKHHFYGAYWVLLVRQEHSNSHGVVYWENISCHDPNILEGIEEAHQRFSVQ